MTVMCLQVVAYYRWEQYMNYFVHVMLLEIGLILNRVWHQLYRIPAPISTIFNPDNPLEEGILGIYQRRIFYKEIMGLVDELTISIPRLTTQEVKGLAAVENQIIFLFHAHAFIIQHVSPCRFVQTAVFKYLNTQTAVFKYLNTLNT